MQDINVFVRLDTKAKTTETLMPLILALDGVAAYKEYTAFEALAADFAASKDAYKAAKAMYDQQALTGYAPQRVAVLGLASDVTTAAMTDALDTLRDSHDDWYYLVLAAGTDAQITALAAWAAATVLTEQQLASGIKEAEKLLAAQTANAALAVSNAQAVICYNPAAATTMMHAAWVGRMATYYPMAVPWKWKALVGIGVVDIDAEALDDLLTAHINTYVNNHKRNYMRDGTCADGEYIDVVIGRWQVKQLIREALANLFVDTDNVPYNDAGFAQVGGAVISALRQAAEYNIIRKVDGSPAISITIPAYADATEEQISKRIMPPILWSATLQGGVHSATVSGTLTIQMQEV